MLRPATENCGVGLASHCHSSRSGRHALQLGPVVKSRAPGGRGAATGALMWTTLFGVAFVISFSALFAAIAMDY